MFRPIVCIVLTCLALVAMQPRASAASVTIHTEDAKATLLALENPSLSRDQALAIARMHGNEAVLQKLHEFKIPSTEKDFANALYSSAHGQAVTVPTETAIELDLVKPKIHQLLELLSEIQTRPQDFQGFIQERIAQFSPQNMTVRLDGYIVAAGDGGGYAFGGTDFFLNIGIVDDFVVARNTTTHELYHAVQGAFAAERRWKAGSSNDSNHQSCASVARLFASMYEEGSATYVEDISQLAESHSAIAVRMKTDLDEGIRHARTSAALLDMSVVSLTAASPVPYDSVYEVGFLGHGTLYDIAYVMAKAIVAQDGPQGLTHLLTQPPYQFILHYTQLPEYGAGEDDPPLGANTIAAAKQLAAGCTSTSKL